MSEQVEQRGAHLSRAARVGEESNKGAVHLRSVLARAIRAAVCLHSNHLAYMRKSRGEPSPHPRLLVADGERERRERGERHQRQSGGRIVRKQLRLVVLYGGAEA